MSIVTISRGSYSRGKNVAEKLSKILGYECISREILLEASEQFNIPEIKLFKGIHDGPSVLDRLRYGKDKYVTYIQNALLKHIAKGDLVYHGMAGHFLLQGIPNVLKVRIVAGLEYRVEVVMKRDGVTADKARKTLLKDDEERKRWSMHLYGKDPWDPTLYDLVIHIDVLSVDDAVDIIANALDRPCFVPTAESAETIDTMLLVSNVKCALIDKIPLVNAFFDKGAVHVSLEDSPLTQNLTVNRAKAIIQDAGIDADVQIEVRPIMTID